MFLCLICLLQNPSNFHLHLKWERNVTSLLTFSARESSSRRCIQYKEFQWLPALSFLNDSFRYLASRCPPESTHPAVHTESSSSLSRCAESQWLWEAEPRWASREVLRLFHSPLCFLTSKICYFLKFVNWQFGMFKPLWRKCFCRCSIFTALRQQRCHRQVKVEPASGFEPI